MKQIILCFFICGAVLFSCDAMDKKSTHEKSKRPVNSPRNQISSLSSPRLTVSSINSIILEFGEKEEDKYKISLGDENFREVNSDKKKKQGQKNNQNTQRILVLDQHELGPLVAYIKEREGFFSAAQMKEKDEKIISLEKTIKFLDTNSTLSMNDTRTFAEKNVVQIGILSFAAGVTLVSSIWLWHLK